MSAAYPSVLYDSVSGNFVTVANASTAIPSGYSATPTVAIPAPADARMTAQPLTDPLALVPSSGPLVVAIAQNVSKIVLGRSVLRTGRGFLVRD